MSRRRGSFKRKVDAIIDSRWPGRWFQNNINNDFTENGNNKLTNTSGDIINVNTGEQVNMALLGMLFKKDNAVMGMWDDVTISGTGYDMVTRWETDRIKDGNSSRYFGVIGYLNSYFGDRRLTAFLMSYNFKMFPSRDTDPLAPTIRGITNNCNEDHLIDPLSSPIETYAQFGTTAYSCMIRTNQQGMIKSTVAPEVTSYTGQVEQEGVAPQMKMKGSRDLWIPKWEYPAEGDGKIQYTGWRFKFLYPNSRAMNTGKDHFLQQEQFFPHNRNQVMNRALLYGSAVRTPLVPWFAPNYVPAYIQGAGEEKEQQFNLPGTNTNVPLCAEGDQIKTLITNAGTGGGTWPLAHEHPDGPFLANNLYNNKGECDTIAPNMNYTETKYRYLNVPGKQLNQKWKTEADTYNNILAKAMKTLFTPSKFLNTTGPIIYSTAGGGTLSRNTYVDQAGYNDVECDSYSGWDGCPYKYYKNKPQQRGWNGDPAALSMCEKYATSLLQANAVEVKEDGNVVEAKTSNKYFIDGDENIPGNNSHYAMRGTDAEANIGNLPEYVPDCNRNALFLGFCPPLPRKYHHVDVITDNWKGLMQTTCYLPDAQSLPQKEAGKFQLYKGKANTYIYPPNLYTKRIERQNICYEMKQNDYRGGSKVSMKECTLKFKLVLPAVKYQRKEPEVSIYGSKAVSDLAANPENRVRKLTNPNGTIIPGQLNLITTPVKIAFRIILYRNARNGKIIDPNTEAIPPLRLENLQDKIQLRMYKIYADKLVWWKRGMTIKTESNETNSGVFKRQTDGSITPSAAAQRTLYYYPRSIKHFKFFKKNKSLLFMNEKFCYPSNLDFVFLRVACWKYNCNGDIISTRLKYIDEASGVLVNVKEKDILGDFRQRFWSTHYWKSAV